MSSVYVAKDGQRTGPFEESEVFRRVAEGLLGPNDLCWREGMADWQRIATVLDLSPLMSTPPPIPATPPHDGDRAAALFLHIPVSRLIVMSIVSFSFYEMYWIYKNWRHVKERDHLDIRPFWRGWFGIFYCHSLMRRIHDDKEARFYQMPLFSPGSLATGWVVLIIISNVVGRAPGIGASIISAFIPSFLCLVPVQNYVNSVSERRCPNQPYYRWSSGHIVCLVFGGVIWALLLFGLGAEWSAAGR